MQTKKIEAGGAFLAPLAKAFYKAFLYFLDVIMILWC